MVNETFSYGSALQGSQIRVLVIQPTAHEADAISCTLEITALDKPCQYDALSYSWSDREDGVVEFCRSILCNGYSSSCHLLEVVNRETACLVGNAYLDRLRAGPLRKRDIVMSPKEIIPQFSDPEMMMSGGRKDTGDEQAPCN